MFEFSYIELDEVLALHYDQIGRYGGSHGVRDLDLLISAISRPQASFNGEDLYKSSFMKSASLMHSLILNHPFIDGNKRTGMISGAKMLFDNGYVLDAPNKDLEKPALKIASKKWDMEKISKWLEKNSNKI